MTATAVQLRLQSSCRFLPVTWTGLSNSKYSGAPGAGLMVSDAERLYLILPGADSFGELHRDRNHSGDLNSQW